MRVFIQAFSTLSKSSQASFICEMELFSFVFLATILLAISHASSHGGLPLPINLLRPQTGSGGLHGVSCASWRLAVETNNIRDWPTVPIECENYVGHYMLGDRYRQDSKAVTFAAIDYAKKLNLTRNGKEVWVFDVDETVLSNLPYYASHGFGAEPFNSTASNQWVNTGKAMALPESLKLYKTLIRLGIKVIFLTGRPESQRSVTADNLKLEGYNTWAQLILRGSTETKMPAVAYKSSHRDTLVGQGYTIVGNIGDQWSDILGTSTGLRTFKLPDPMYYIG